MKSEFDDLKIGETKIVRMDARKKHKACSNCRIDKGILNVVVTRHDERSYGSRNYCDRCLPDTGRLFNLRDEAMAPNKH